MTALDSQKMYVITTKGCLKLTEIKLSKLPQECMCSEDGSKDFHQLQLAFAIGSQNIPLTIPSS